MLIKDVIGFEMPVLGLGVYQNWECYPGCITAIKAGYRYALQLCVWPNSTHKRVINAGTLTQRGTTRTKPKLDVRCANAGWRGKSFSLVSDMSYSEKV